MEQTYLSARLSWFSCGIDAGRTVCAARSSAKRICHTCATLSGSGCEGGADIPVCPPRSSFCGIGDRTKIYFAETFAKSIRHACAKPVVLRKPCLPCPAQAGVRLTKDLLRHGIIPERRLLCPT